jgi:hypothetical protein
MQSRSNVRILVKLFHSQNDQDYGLMDLDKILSTKVNTVHISTNNQNFSDQKYPSHFGLGLENDLCSNTGVSSSSVRTHTGGTVRISIFEMLLHPMGLSDSTIQQKTDGKVLCFSDTFALTSIN